MSYAPDEIEDAETVTETKVVGVIEREMIDLVELLGALEALSWEGEADQIQALVRHALHQAKVCRHLVSDAMSGMASFDMPKPLHEE
jgi:hypothetical protein